MTQIIQFAKLAENLNIQIKNSPQISQETLVLRSILEQILEECLFSTQYGLETYLSSRIRHGYCRGQLTSFLRELHLVSLRDKEDDSYHVNPFWDAEFKGDKGVLIQVKNVLSDFTALIEKKIDEINCVKPLTITLKFHTTSAMKLTTTLYRFLMFLLLMICSIRRSNMSILLIEDEPSKEKNVVAFLGELLPDIKVVIKHSITSGKIEIRKNTYDHILLDMSLPLFDNDDMNYMDENEFETFGGISVLDEIDRLDKICKVIVITAFDILGEGNDKIDLPQINKRLKHEYPQIFVGTVFYNTSSLEWKDDMSHLLLNNANKEE